MKTVKFNYSILQLPCTNRIMNNYFINQEPYTRPARTSVLTKFLKIGLKHLRIGDLRSPAWNPMIDMTTVEQRISYFHLLKRVIDHEIPGEVVELGTFTGYCAMLFQKIIEQCKSDKVLHVYDSFEVQFTKSGSIQNILVANFEKAKLTLPVIHKGYFQDTLPTQLPKHISFAHLDCGFGGDKFEHRDVLLFCLKEVYPRLSKGAICVLMDYMAEDGIDSGCDVNPGAKLAVTEFLKDKPETMIGLYGNQCYHGYFIKL